MSHLEVFSHEFGFSVLTADDKLAITTFGAHGQRIAYQQSGLNVDVNSIGWFGKECYIYANSSVWASAAEFIQVFPQLPCWEMVVPLERGAGLYKHITSDELRIVNAYGDSSSILSDWSGRELTAKWPSRYWIQQDEVSTLMLGVDAICELKAPDFYRLFESKGVIFGMDRDKRLSAFRQNGELVGELAASQDFNVIDVSHNEKRVVVIGVMNNNIVVATADWGERELVTKCSVPFVHKFCLSGDAESLVFGDGRLCRLSSLSWERWGKETTTGCSAPA